jgi:hypothetical protein
VAELTASRPCDWADCGRTPIDPSAIAQREQRVLDLMAKDYDSLLRVMLDALPAVAPQWQSRTEADLGMALLELFAFAGDQISYLQDRVALEGFLRTATQFESVRRLLRLVDYVPDPGHAARADLVFDASGNAPFVLPAGFAVATLALPSEQGANAVVFETVQDEIIYPALSNIALALEAPSSADGRQAVLASVDTAMIGAGTRLLFAAGRQREWAEVDSAVIGIATTTLTLKQPLANRYPAGVARTVRGNVVEATHGATQSQDEQGTGLPNQSIELELAPLTYVLDADGQPQSTLAVTVDGERWSEVEDFVASGAADPHYRTIRDNAGYITVTFGDGDAGRMPAAGARIRIVYRVGIGESGRVAADALKAFTPRSFADPSQHLNAVTNPFAASDPGEPQSMAQAKLVGPRQLEIQNRAVVEADYEAVAAEGVRVGDARIVPVQAKARFRWTGSWTTVFVSIDLPERAPLAATAGLREAFESALATRKLAGLDVRVEDARYAALHIGLRIDVIPEYFARDVRHAVEAVLVGSPGDGRIPFFGPGRFRFGQPVYLSDLYAAVAAVAGVQAVAVTRFKRLGDRYPDCEAQGFIPVGSLEVARCDNDPLHPEHGLLSVRTCGGKEG